MRWILMGTLLATVACGDPLGVGEGDLPLFTVLDNAEVETVGDGYRAVLAVSFRNLADRTLYLRRGCGVEVQRLVGDEWEQASGGNECLSAIEQPIEVPQRGVEDWQVTARFDDFPSGQYRAVLTQASESAHDGDPGRFAELLPLSLRISNDFAFLSN